MKSAKRRAVERGARLDVAETGARGEVQKEWWAWAEGRIALADGTAGEQAATAMDNAA